MALPIAERWFETQVIDDQITLLCEPHVVPLMRCNIWHVSGRDRNLIVDTGMGVVSLVDALRDLGHRADKSTAAVATHGHDDHIGSHHEFDQVLMHPAEASVFGNPLLDSLDPIEGWGIEAVQALRQTGYEFDDTYFVTALPPGYVLESFRQKPATVTRLIDEGDVVDLGDRQFEVLHLPGHSQGSIGLWEEVTGTLFSGDAIYDGPLLDELPGSNIADYCATMERLLKLPVNVVHAGHDPSFGRDRLHTLARNYLELRADSTG